MRLPQLPLLVLCFIATAAACDDHGASAAGDAQDPADTTATSDSTTADSVVQADSRSETQTAPPQDTATSGDSGPAHDTIHPGDTGSSADTALPRFVCADPCDERAADTSSGLCTDQGYFSHSACLAYCAPRAPHWDSEARAAFERCATTDPLCFQTIHQCMMHALFEQEISDETPIPMEVVVVGAGLEAHNGRWAYVSMEFGFGGTSRVEQGQISDGGFATLWDVTSPPPLGGEVTVRAYIDDNEDLSCDAEDDVTFRGFALPRFETTPLRFALTVSPADMAEEPFASAICDSF